MGLLELLMSPKQLIVILVLVIVILVGGFTAVLTIGLDKILAYVMLILVLVNLPKLKGVHNKLDKNTAIILGILLVIALSILLVPSIKSELSGLSIASLGGA